MNILEKFMHERLAAVAIAKSTVSLDQLREAASERVHHSLKAGLMVSGKTHIISEMKKASPSAGVIRADFDPVAIATAYAEHGAAAISCLTDEKYFQGSLDFIARIREAVSLPVLRKDCLITE